MIAQDFLERLEAVSPRGNGRWRARCPAHADRHPSLSVQEGERGLLVYCFAGCSFDEIMTAVGITSRDLFYDQEADPQMVRAARHRRHLAREQREALEHAMGLAADTLRAADTLVQSAKDLDISTWSNERLHRELNRLAEAYALLDAEGLMNVA